MKFNRLKEVKGYFFFFFQDDVIGEEIERMNPVIADRCKRNWA